MLIWINDTPTHIYKGRTDMDDFINHGVLSFLLLFQSLHQAQWKGTIKNSEPAFKDTNDAFCKGEKMASVKTWEINLSYVKAF